MRKTTLEIIQEIGALIQKPYSIEEILTFENDNDLIFHSDFKDFMLLSRNVLMDWFGKIKLQNGLVFSSPTVIFTLDWNDVFSWTNTIREVGMAEMEDMDSFFNFGTTLDVDEVRYYIGVKEPYIGQIFIWYYLNGEAEESATFDEERQIYVYPKIKICDSFYDFLEFLINNQENFKNDIIAEI